MQQPLKTENRFSMVIKASGYALKDLGVDRGWRKLDVLRVNAILGDVRLKELPESQREEIVKGIVIGSFLSGAKRSA